ncbi:MAG: hypothetical protein ACRCXT_15800 [Paraclostridium sp.]|uniref:hypothetical protein n=1 Tax=uncultured Cetobacterium sp. TaxID=527638 RepID=UPI0025ECD00A|nr:hypothetical protein [uncultured Cetobacterium sp.]
MIELDYGESPKFMVIGNFELINSLNNWEAIYYLLQGDYDKEITSSSISLVFKDKNSAQISYDLFIESINKHQTSEIIDIIFVEIDEGYKVFIAQNPNVLIKNVVPSYLEPWVTPICTGMTKPLFFPKKSKEFLMFKNYKRQNKDSVIRVTHSYRGLLGRVIPISKEGFISNNILVLTEEEAREYPMIKSYFIKNIKKEIEKNKKIMFETSDEEVSKRKKNLKYFYPLTLDKILYEGYLEEQVQLLREKHEESIIYQAICNLIYHHRLKKVNIPFKSWKSLDFLEYLLKVPETFNSIYPEDKYFSLGRIESQIKYTNKKKENK